MSFAVVFFPHSSSADVVPVSAVHGDVRRGAVTKAKWGGRTYSAKVLYVGAKELCELKIKNVTASGELRAEEFEHEAVEELSPNRPSHTCCGLELAQAVKELTLRNKEMEENLATLVDLVSRLTRRSERNELGLERMEKMLTEVMERLPAPQEQINYRFVTPEKVAALRKISDTPAKFVRKLEKEVFKDRREELSQKVDDRQSVDRISFMKACLNKYFEVKPDLQDSVWQKVVTSLNTRARTVRKHQRDNGHLREDNGNPGTSGLSYNDIYEFDE